MEENKKELTTEELRAQVEALSAELHAREKAEEEARNAKLREEREERYKEVIYAYENFEELRSKYVEDYGYFTFEKTRRTYDSTNRTPSIWDWLV